MKFGDDKYTQHYALEAEGYRIGLMICRRCGATILIGGDGTDDAPKLHDDWHDHLSTPPKE